MRPRSGFARHEEEGRVLCIVPHATDTPMVRALIDAPEDQVPVSSLFRTAAANGTLATPQQVAHEIWAAIDERRAKGQSFTSARPPSHRRATSASRSPRAGDRPAEPNRGARI